MLKINGRPEPACGLSLTELIQAKGYPLKRVAVEMNGRIVPKAQYDATVPQDGDALEIVSFVGGG